MAEPSDPGAQSLKRGFGIFGAGTAALFFGGLIIGVMLRQIDRGGPLGLRPMLMIGFSAIALAGCLWLLARLLRTPAGEHPLTAKERLNRNILILCGTVGGLLGGAMSLVAPRELSRGLTSFSDTPLPPAFALIAVLLIGVLLPAISIYWHRHATDEMEADAYKTGALYALNVYMIGAPVWWFLWRGGLAPAPNGIAIYFITVGTVGIFWIWKKYR